MHLALVSLYACLGLVSALAPLSDSDEVAALQLASAAVDAARRHIVRCTTTLVIMDHCELCTSRQRSRQTQLLDYVLKQTVQSLALQLFVGTLDEQPWDYSLFIVNKPRAFDELRFSLPNTLHEREFYFLVVLTERLWSLADVQHIFATSLQFNVINVVVMVQREDGQIILYKHRIFRPDCKHVIDVMEFNRYDPETGRFQNDVLFPAHFRDFHFCALNVSAQQLPPHFMYRGKSSGGLLDESDLRRISGIDGELLRLLAKKMRFRIRLYVPSRRSEIWSAGNYSGCFAQLASGVANMAIGGLSGSDRNRQYFSLSAVYQLNYLVFVVANDKDIPQVAHLLCPFRNRVWNLLLLLLLAVLLATPWLRAYLPHPVESLLASTFGNPIGVHRLSGRISVRYLLASWLLFTLVLRSAYQGKMFDVLRVSRPKPLPNGLGDLLAQNYTLVSGVFFDFYPESRTRLVPGKFSVRFKLVQRAKREDRIATISLINNLAHWNMENWDSSRLVRLHEPVYVYQVVLYFPKHSIFKFVFDRKIEQLEGSGILNHLEQRFVQGHRFIDMNARERQNPCITNDMLHGLYFCHFSLLLLASLLFLLELVSVRSPLLHSLLRRL
ncbi:uncharacterized protein LOC115629334 [Scaptodrosophila lebanonensis]|uniref:Uncharacterized protein LOC115629334 n=1 Tax=Drosophila lebanonensis TaxID=7225 RepID=A0A6J2U3D3_DROLE|nr:uncharacterized protein LOC115629334 [Scaptodrosophila lebanonensis]